MSEQKIEEQEQKIHDFKQQCSDELIEEFVMTRHKEEYDDFVRERYSELF